jgi:hypothetical protein
MRNMLEVQKCVSRKPITHIRRGAKENLRRSKLWITKGAHTHPPTLICDIVTCVQTLLLLQAHEYAGSNAAVCARESEKCVIIVERIYTHTPRQRLQ